jgi:V/A-type H+-transporting ATPase subunit K
MADATTVASAASGLTTGAGAALGAGLAIGISAIAAAWSQGTLGAAALGVVAERPEFEKSILIYIALPEVLVILGFIIAIMLTGSVAGH